MVIVAVRVLVSPLRAGPGPPIPHEEPMKGTACKLDEWLSDTVDHVNSA